MITTDNKAANQKNADRDFTMAHYRELFSLAAQHYTVASYSGIPWGSRFILWRHDLDYSLNRGLALAKVEHEEGVRAAYFVNPHSEFYNIAEDKQYKIIKDILSLGHDLGLHFDAAFYDIMTEQDLENQIAQETDYLYRLFGIKPVAFSFHNPVAMHLAYEADDYGGLVNCYSKRFKTEVGYCSDSNGYWRFRRLHDVLLEAKDDCLQVLTHPGWWQDVPMPPRQRVFRSIYGRARATLRFYDQSLENYGRVNMAGEAQALRFLEIINPDLFMLCDYLWNQGEFQTLFMELWRLHETQINWLCMAQLCQQWRVPIVEVNTFFSEDRLRVDGWKLVTMVFETAWPQAAGIDLIDYQRWVSTRNQLIHGCAYTALAELEEDCVAMCGLIQHLAEWGKSQLVAYDGLAHLDSIGLPTVRATKGSLNEKLEELSDGVSDFPNRRWEELKHQLISSGNTGRE